MNENELEKEIAEITLTQGYKTIVDRGDFCGLSRYKWYATVKDGGRRVVAMRDGRGGEPKSVQMSRQLLNAPHGLIVDHINHDTLDNRRGNLRIVTASQNSQNKRRNKAKESSKFKGVYLFEGKYRPRISIRLAGKTRHIPLGFFDSEEEAAKIYDQAVRELFGKYACLNFDSELKTPTVEKSEGKSA